MRKIGFATLLIGISSLVLSCGEPQKYSSGKDTVVSFGDGNWSIVKTGGGATRKIHLSRHEPPGWVVSKIVDWIREGDWVYAVGEDGVFAVVNFRTNSFAKYDQIEDSPNEHKRNLGRLKKK